jgi:hypothetical protein
VSVVYASEARLKNFVLAGVCVLAIAVTSVEAGPILTLRVGASDGTLSGNTYTTTDQSFTLIAEMKLGAGDSLWGALADIYFISAALVPKTGPIDETIGSYGFAGNTIDVTHDMTYGTPPTELLAPATYDPGDLSDAGVFPTFFNEFLFTFSSHQRRGDGTYYREFAVNTSGLPSPYGLHFDLYDTSLRACLFSNSCGGFLLDHDISGLSKTDVRSLASSGAPVGVPEPSGLILLGLGLAFAAGAKRRVSA